MCFGAVLCVFVAFCVFSGLSVQKCVSFHAKKNIEFSDFCVVYTANYVERTFERPLIYTYVGGTPGGRFWVLNKDTNTLPTAHTTPLQHHWH